MRKNLLTFALLFAVFSGSALADYAIKDGNAVIQTVYAFVCQSTKICTATILSDINGNPLGTSANPLNTTSPAPAGYQWTDVGDCQITSLSSATPVSTCSNYAAAVSAGARGVLINIEVSNVRQSGDGVTTPTASVGNRLYAGSWWQCTCVLANLKFIQETSGGVLNVTFFR